MSNWLFPSDPEEKSFYKGFKMIAYFCGGSFGWAGFVEGAPMRIGTNQCQSSSHVFERLRVKIDRMGV
jgi:hypothetical protein